MIRISILFIHLVVAIEATISNFQNVSSPLIAFEMSPAFDLGVYSTIIQMGTPPQNFTVLIDTGSETSWVPCKSCTNCPQFSGNEFLLHQFDAGASTSERLVSCPEKWCNCSGDQLCNYRISYEDGDGSSGHFIQDSFWLHSNTSTFSFLFGCSTEQYGRFAGENPGFDGILGFNKGALSFVSQLKINAFSYCMKAPGDKKGFLLLGEALHPGLVYSPMDPRTSSYGLYLERIIVNDQTLAIDPKIFRHSKNSSTGTFIDSGSNYMYLIGEAYDMLVAAVNSSVSPYVASNTQMCYQVNDSISKVFPTITLSFAQGANLVLQPYQYLFSEYTVEGPTEWCFNFIRTNDMTILGDLIFQDKLVVYDLVHKRIGWGDYDCAISDKELAVNLAFLRSNANVTDQAGTIYSNVIYVVTIFLFLIEYT